MLGESGEAYVQALARPVRSSPIDSVPLDRAQTPPRKFQARCGHSLAFGLDWPQNSLVKTH